MLFAKFMTTELTIDLRPLAERFWAGVDATGEGCWPWTRYVNPMTGYGQYTPRVVERLALNMPRVVTAPVMACTLAHGPRPAGLEVLHSCDNRACCRPEHLRWGTHRENNQEAWTRGRQLRGERHHRAKYTDDQVRQLRDACASGERVPDAARRLGINPWTAYKIARGQARLEEIK